MSAPTNSPRIGESQSTREAGDGIGEARSPSGVANTRQTKVFTDQRHRRRYTFVVVGLVVLAGFFTVMSLAWGNPLPFGSDGFWQIAQMRVDALVVIGVVAVSHATATVAFQTVTNNRIITPSIMGFESLYIAIQTAAIYALGVAGATFMTGPVQFFGQAILMVILAMILYTWLLSGRFSNIHIMLLVGVVIGGTLGSAATFMQRMLTPSEFDVLSARMIGSITNARTDYLPYAVPVALIAALALWIRSRKLNVVSLGPQITNNLGLTHRFEVMKVLFFVSILMAMSTSLVGPMTFLGFLAAMLAYQLCDTYSHQLLFPVAILSAYTVLVGSYFVLSHIFYAQGAVTIVVEAVGGTVFLVYLLRKGRL